MQKLLAQKIEELRRLIGNTRSASFLLAVSGGMDSMCMADLFLNEVGTDSFAIAHCNFHLRGGESDGDEALVRAWAESNGVRMHRVDFDTATYAGEHGVSIEMAARDLRYGWFEQLCDEFGYNVVAVAHNANDNAETLMLNLLRGTGLNGLHGMVEVSVFNGRTDCRLHWPPPTSWAPPQPATAGCSLQRSTGPFANRSRGCENANSVYQSAPPILKQKRLFRPLLEVTRKQIEGYVLAHRVPYRHDSSNFESEYKRNRIRNEIFPVFEKINPSFVRTLNREIGYFAEAGSIVEDWCRAQMPQVLDHPELPACHPERSEVSLSISLPSLLATDHWRYLLYYILQQYGFNSQTIASVEDLLASDRTISGKRFDSPTHTLRTERDVLYIHKNVIDFESDRQMTVIGMPPPAWVCLNEVKAGAKGGHCLSDASPVRGTGIYNFNGVRWQVEELEWSSEMPLRQPQGVLIADADKLLFPFVCRPWRQGDWFVPLGMRGKKKVSDLFADLKYTSFQKVAALMIVDTRTEGLAEQQHIAGVLGVRIDDRYKVTPQTTRIIRFTILNNTETL